MSEYGFRQWPNAKDEPPEQDYPRMTGCLSPADLIAVEQMVTERQQAASHDDIARAMVADAYRQRDIAIKARRFWEQQEERSRFMGDAYRQDAEKWRGVAMSFLAVAIAFGLALVMKGR